MRRVLIVLIVLGLSAAGAVYFIREQQANAEAAKPTIRSVPVDRGDLTLTVNATGTIAPLQTAKLSFVNPGLVQEVLVEEGQPVKAGQLLVRQDDGAQKLALAQADANLQVAQLTLQQLMAPANEQELAIAQANIKAAQDTYSALLASVDPNAIKVAELRYQQALTAWQDANIHTKDVGGQVPTESETYQLALAQEGQASFTAETARLQLEILKRGVDGRTLNAAATRITQAKAELERLKAGPPQIQMDRAQLTIDQAILLRDQANKQLEHTRLTAPFAGLVTFVGVKPGALTVNTIPAIILTDATQLHVDVDVDEIDIGQVRSGQTVHLTLDALPDTALTGTVDQIALTGNQSTNIVTYGVRIALEPTQVRVRVGMTTSATIIVKEQHDVLRVLNLYVRLDRRTNQAFVNLVNSDGSLTEVPIQLGLRTEDYSEVTGGLNEGDVIGINLNGDAFSLFGN